MNAADAPPQPRPLAAEGLDDVDFGPDGLVPAIVQDLHTREVLMLGFMNRPMLQRTLDTGNAWFWSRSRQSPWLKGETSGNYIRVREIRRNCYDNSLLLLSEPVGPVCHTGALGCYYRTLDGTETAGTRPPPSNPLSGTDPLTAKSPDFGSPREPGTLDWLFDVLRRRQVERPEGSYVVKLLDQGVDRIAKKVGEEAAEVIIAAKNRSRDELAAETADLWFHSLLLLLDAGMAPSDIYQALASRHREPIAGTDGSAGKK
jgi:phosphoribosyl-AMP cyclohydrolase / phosphoribosyl-ATP pyrophosphohydrolase